MTASNARHRVRIGPPCSSGSRPEYRPGEDRGVARYGPERLSCIVDANNPRLRVRTGCTLTHIKYPVRGKSVERATAHSPRPKAERMDNLFQERHCLHRAFTRSAVTRSERGPPQQAMTWVVPQLSALRSDF